MRDREHLLARALRGKKKQMARPTFNLKSARRATDSHVFSLDVRDQVAIGLNSKRLWLLFGSSVHRLYVRAHLWNTPQRRKQSVCVVFDRAHTTCDRHIGKQSHIFIKACVEPQAQRAKMGRKERHLRNLS
jgi:hypothetical protein